MGERWSDRSFVFADYKVIHRGLTTRNPKPILTLTCLAVQIRQSWNGTEPRAVDGVGPLLRLRGLQGAFRSRAKREQLEKIRGDI